MPEPVPTSKIPLADLVEAVRRDLQVAAIKGRGEVLQFEVGEIQLEAEVGATRDRGAEAKVEIWVLAIGGKAKREDSATQKVTLKLSPVAADGSKFKVSRVTAKPVNRDS